MMRSYRYKKYARLTRWVLAILLLSAMNLNGFSQKRDYRFHYYTSDQGLSQNYIDCILRDSRGYMWFGTRNGLNRFDAYDFAVFKNDPGNDYSLSSNFVQALCEDKFGNIWVGTNEGVDLYLYKEDRFVPYTKESKEHLPIQNVSINTIISDHKGDIWIGTDNGILVITIDSKGNSTGSSRYYHAAQSTGSISGNLVNFIYQDRYNRIWIGTNSGLNLYDWDTDSFISYNNSPANPATLSSDEVTAIFFDRSDKLWVGTNNGLNRFDDTNEVFERYFHIPDQPSSISLDVITCITEDLNGDVLIGTLGGLSIYNEEQNNFDNYAYDINSQHGINNDFINAILADEQGNVWIGTERGGINRYNTFQNEFDYFIHIPGNENSLSHNSVNSIWEDNKSLWIGTAGGGLNRLDKKTGIYHHFQSVPSDPNSISSNFITSIVRDNDGNLWIGTWGSGLNFLTAENIEQGSFEHFLNQPGNPGSLINNYVSSIIKDDQGNLWIGTRGGVAMHVPGSSNFEYLPADNTGMQISLVGCLRFDHSGNLWVGTEEGLYKLSPKNSASLSPENYSVTRYLKSLKTEGAISGNYVISIHIDQKGTPWFGTYGDGINTLVYDSVSGEAGFINYTQRDGLVNDIIYGILEDDEGSLWLSTDNGLSKFNPVTEEFTNYSLSDGLLSNQFYWTAAFKNDEGRMYFGGMKGLLAFHPEKIVDRRYEHNLSITKFMIYNQHVEIGKEYYDHIVLENPLSDISRIRLPSKIREFSIGFSALDYDQTDKIEYAYMLEGFDDEWNFVGSDRRYASYTNLKGGEYNLLIKTTIIEGDWSQVPYALAIEIIPPLWARSWFISLVSGMILLILAGSYRYRVYTLKERKKLLQALVTERTQQIEGQKEQLEMQNLEIIEQREKLMDLNKKVQEANRQQMRFFTHMSHEFRTPLTLIISPLDEITREMEGRNPLLHKLTLMKKNARRLLHLVNQLMEVRRIKTGNIEIQAREVDIVKFLDNISQPFSSLAKHKNLEYDFITSRKSIKTYVDTEKLEIIFYNLVSNAIKYTPEFGRVSIEVSQIECLSQFPKDDELAIVKQKGDSNQQFISIVVRDSGIGIETDQLKDVFKRFYKSTVDYNNHFYGVGIGLYLTKELVKAHRGWLFVNSTPNLGSDFKCLIPYGKEYLEDHEITDKSSGPVLESTSLPKESVLEEYIETSQLQSTSPIFKEHNIPSAKPLILIVDDDLELCDYISGFLSKDFEIIIAENGEEGLEKAFQFLPDLILSDNMMPKMDGYDFCAQIKSNLQTSHIPFVLISARTDEDAMIEGLDVGADDYITKPFEIKVLEAKLKTLIENRVKLRRLFSSSLISDLKKVTTSSVDSKFLKQAVATVENHLMDSQFGVQSLAEKLNISRSLLHKKLTAIVGQSSNDFIVSIRLKHSAKLIIEGNKKISEIAYQVGFNDPKYFTRCFKKHFGKTPTEYLQKQV